MEIEGKGSPIRRFLSSEKNSP